MTGGWDWLLMCSGAAANHRGALLPPCAAPPETLAHGPSQMPVSCPVAPASQRELHKDGGGGGVAGRARVARAQVLRYVLWNALRNVLCRVLHVLVLYVSPKGERGGGARVRVAARRSIPFFAP